MQNKMCLKFLCCHFLILLNIVIIVSANESYNTIYFNPTSNQQFNSSATDNSQDVPKLDTSKKPFSFFSSLFPLDSSSGINSSHIFHNWTDVISRHLTQIVDSELGVKRLQQTFDALAYEETQDEDKMYLTQIVESLDNKISAYTKLILNMTSIVRESYQRYKKKLKKQRTALNNSMFDYLEHDYELDREKSSPQYYPCCVIPDNFLIYDPLFGKRVNTELWCDSGLDQNRLNEPYSEYFYTPLKLTETFALNHRIYPSLKWQFFISSDGIHTEFPAHRSGTSVSSECGKSNRHHDIYEATVRPKGRNIVMLFDLGYMLTPRLLLTAKGIGHYVVSTLGDNDRVAVLGAANRLFSPKATCMKKSLLPATSSVKHSLRNFLDYMEIHDGKTNHTLALERVMEIIKHSFTSKRTQMNPSSVLIMYVTRGYVENIGEAHDALKVLASWIDTIDTNVVISTYGLDISHEERPLLEILAYQQFEKYNLKIKKQAHAGDTLRISPTLRLAPVLQNFYEVAYETLKLKTNSSTRVSFSDDKKVTISEPYWDSEGKGMVVTLSKEIYADEGDLAGVVGIDLSLSHLLEGATYFDATNQGYAMVIDHKENIISHPHLGRPESWKAPLLPISATFIEPFAGFSQVLPHLTFHSEGVKKIKVKSKKFREYLWKKSDELKWVFVISRDSSSSSLNFKLISRRVASLSTNALFHRLDLLSPQEAKVCRYFNQMATLNEASVFLSPSAFKSPTDFFAKSHKNINIFGNIMAYLTDSTKLLANPGLKEGVREEASALHSIAAYWKSYHTSSELHNYIIRRYGATKSGVAVMYPGTLVDTSYDPRSQEWYLNAIKNPGKVIISSPFLDPGGAGYVVTVSHTVYQCKASEIHSASEHILAVLAADFTLGFFHKLLADMEPACAQAIYYLQEHLAMKESPIRCFLVDASGYLLVHPSYILPSLSSHSSAINLPNHLTHQEPVLSMALLGKSQSGTKGNRSPGLKKHWCGRWWQGSSERLYSFQLETGQILSSFSKNFKSDHTCLQYILAPVKESNLIFGIVNQTCSPPAFCPCSTSRLDRQCLNCQLMEASSCECPCSCSLPSQPCSQSTHPKLPVMVSWHSSSEMNKSISKESHSTNMFHRDEVFTRTYNNKYGGVLTCPREPEPPGLLPHGIGMLSQLELCVHFDCSIHTNVSSCMGVKDCVWCLLEGNGFTFLPKPYCTRMNLCYGGIKGSPSPYPPGISPLPHSEERGSNFPIGAVAGGFLAVFLVMALSLYCYRTYIGDSSVRGTYTPSLHNQMNHSPLYQPEPENPHDELLGDGIISASAAAAISPYRMNPGYRRPVCHHGEASDHGYSTMTPHEESENLTSTDIAGAASLYPGSSVLEDERGSSTHWSDHSEPSEHINPTFGSEEVGLSFQTQLSSPRRIGPNKLLVPVTVHMVDTV